MPPHFNMLFEKEEDMTNTIIKTAGGMMSAAPASRLLQDREVHLFGIISPETAEETFELIRILEKESRTEPIDVFIYSPGGDANAGMLIYDAMMNCEAPVRTWCTGAACSIAALLVAAGRNGRYIYPHSRMLLHEPFASGEFSGLQADDLKRTASRLAKEREQLAELLSKHTGKSRRTIRRAIAYDHFFTAEEAVRFGLADGICSAGRGGK